MVGVVVVNYNDTQGSIECLASTRHPRVLPILVDSASEDDPTDAVVAAIPGAVVHRMQRNAGFAAACNAGTRLAVERGACHILLLNSDAVLETGALDALIVAAALHPNCILGPLIVYAGDAGRVWSAGGYVVRPWMKNHHLGQESPVDQHIAEGPVDWVTGCALFFPAGAFEQVGPLDEDFFLYLEDVDWCLRAGRAGVGVRCVPAAVVRHAVSRSVRTLPRSDVRYYSYRNHYRLAFRHCAAWARPLIAADLGWTFAKIGLRWTLFASYRRDSHYHARTRALVDFLRGRWGQAPADLAPAAAELAGAGRGR